MKKHFILKIIKSPRILICFVGGYTTDKIKVIKRNNTSYKTLIISNTRIH